MAYLPLLSLVLACNVKHVTLMSTMVQEKNPRFRESGDSDDDEDGDEKRRT